MGFLSGAYGKIMAGKLVRQLQYQMTSVQSRLNRVTKQVGEMEKQFSAAERNMRSMMQMQMQNSVFGMMGVPGYSAALQAQGVSDASQLQAAQMQDYQKYIQNQQYIQQYFAFAQSQWQDMFDMKKEAMLQPLKDLEEDLQVEKDNLESRLKMAEQQYEAKKKEEDAGAKSFAPEYTSQG